MASVEMAVRLSWLSVSIIVLLWTPSTEAVQCNTDVHLFGGQAGPSGYLINLFENYVRDNYSQGVNGYCASCSSTNTFCVTLELHGDIEIVGLPPGRGGGHGGHGGGGFGYGGGGGSWGTFGQGYGQSGHGGHGGHGSHGQQGYGQTGGFGFGQGNHGHGHGCAQGQGGCSQGGNGHGHGHGHIHGQNPFGFGQVQGHHDKGFGLHGRGGNEHRHESRYETRRHQKGPHYRSGRSAFPGRGYGFPPPPGPSYGGYGPVPPPPAYPGGYGSYGGGFSGGGFSGGSESVRVTKLIYRSCDFGLLAYTNGQWHGWVCEHLTGTSGLHKPGGCGRDFGGIDPGYVHGHTQQCPRMQYKAKRQAGFQYSEQQQEGGLVDPDQPQVAEWDGRRAELCRSRPDSPGCRRRHQPNVRPRERYPHTVQPSGYGHRPPQEPYRPYPSSYGNPFPPNPYLFPGQPNPPFYPPPPHYPTPGLPPCSICFHKDFATNVKFGTPPSSHFSYQTAPGVVMILRSGSITIRCCNRYRCNSGHEPQPYPSGGRPPVYPPAPCPRGHPPGASCGGGGGGHHHPHPPSGTGGCITNWGDGGAGSGYPFDERSGYDWPIYSLPNPNTTATTGEQIGPFGGGNPGERDENFDDEYDFDPNGGPDPDRFMGGREFDPDGQEFDDSDPDTAAPRPNPNPSSRHRSSPSTNLPATAAPAPAPSAGPARRQNLNNPNRSLNANRLSRQRAAAAASLPGDQHSLNDVKVVINLDGQGPIAEKLAPMLTPPPLPFRGGPAVDTKNGSDGKKHLGPNEKKTN